MLFHPVIYVLRRLLSFFVCFVINSSYSSQNMRGSYFQVPPVKKQTSLALRCPMTPKLDIWPLFLIDMQHQAYNKLVIRERGGG